MAVSFNDDVIAQAAARLRAGGLVAFPTETVYGLGANALNGVAVAKIFELKGRPRFDPLIVHVADPSDVHAIVRDVPEVARKLAAQFWPGPLTLVLPRDARVPEIVSAGLPTVAVRCPDHTIARNLIRLAECPVAAPSANRFGKVSPTTAGHVRESFGTDTPFLVDGGPCRVGVESTVVSCTERLPRLLRPGGVTLEELTAVIGEVSYEPLRMEPAVVPSSPGMLSSHYAPATPLQIVDRRPELAPGLRAGLLTWCPVEQTALQDANGFVAVRTLSHSGALPQAAASLFGALRELDELGLDVIFATRVAEVGLGLAIMDRLTRAAHRAVPSVGLRPVD